MDLRLGGGVDDTPYLARSMSTEGKTEPLLIKLLFDEGRRHPALGVHHVDGGVDGALPWGHSMSVMV